MVDDDARLNVSVLVFLVLCNQVYMQGWFLRSVPFMQSSVSADAATMLGQHVICSLQLMAGNGIGQDSVEQCHTSNRVALLIALESSVFVEVFHKLIGYLPLFLSILTMPILLSDGTRRKGCSTWSLPLCSVIKEKGCKGASLCWHSSGLPVGTDSSPLCEKREWKIWGKTFGFCGHWEQGWIRQHERVEFCCHVTENEFWKWQLAVRIKPTVFKTKAIWVICEVFRVDFLQGCIYWLRRMLQNHSKWHS